MIEPTKNDIGRKVLRIDRGRKTIEEGVLVAFISSYAFIRYGSEVGSKASHFCDVEWATDNATDNA